MSALLVLTVASVAALATLAAFSIEIERAIQRRAASARHARMIAAHKRSAARTRAHLRATVERVTRA